MPRVTSVSYTRLKSMGNYENEKVGVTLELGEGDTPESAFTTAREVVNTQLKITEDMDNLRKLQRDLQFTGERFATALRNISDDLEQLSPQEATYAEGDERTPFDDL